LLFLPKSRKSKRNNVNISFDELSTRIEKENHAFPTFSKVFHREKRKSLERLRKIHR